MEIKKKCFCETRRPRKWSLNLSTKGDGYVKAIWYQRIKTLDQSDSLSL
jgi:hypothetical protein